jgi:hypothetical protein
VTESAPERQELAAGGERSELMGDYHHVPELPGHPGNFSGGT